MVALITDPRLERRIIARRRRLGIDRWDEVWKGVYVMAPSADNQHFDISNDFQSIFTIVIKWPGLGRCVSGVNISDRKEEWRKNFRCPDTAVFLNGTIAEDCGEFWFGGPDFAVEIVSPRDRTRKKIPFYEKVGTRELLIVDRRPWRLSLLRLIDGKLVEAGQSTFDESRELTSAVLPLSFQLSGDSTAPKILVRHRDGRHWTIDAPPPVSRRK